MSEKLDSLLAELPRRGPPPSLDRLRASMAAEKRLPPPSRNVLMMAGLCLGMVSVASVVLLAVGATTPELLAQRALMLVLVCLAATAAAFAALKPPSLRRTAIASAALIGAAAVIVFGRGAGLPSASPPWVCSATHLGIDLFPLAAAMLLLRHAAFRPMSALFAGAAAGSVGAAMGELACTQSWTHVAAYHLPVWLLSAAVGWIVARQLKPRSFVP